MDDNLIIECDNLVKIFKTKDIETVALQGLDLTVEKGELLAIIGNSGSGKSTLLNMLGALDKPSAGKLFVNGEDLLKKDDKELIEYKRKTVGFVWQNNARNLIPYLTVLDNVKIPMLLQGYKNRKSRALELLNMVGLYDRRKHKLSQLSGGEQQRVAIAIAIANNPKLLLADEPTGSVDTKTSGKILDVFRKLNEELGLTIVIVTHDRRLSSKVNRVVAIRDGRTSSEFVRSNLYVKELKSIENETESIEQSPQVELAVLDRAGRLQIPQEYLKALELGNKGKVKVELEGKKIVLVNPSQEG